MSNIFGNSELFQSVGVFSAEGGEATPAPAAPAPAVAPVPAPVVVDPNDGTTTVVVQDPTTHTPDGSSDLETSGDLTLITDPDADDDDAALDVIDLDDDDASADIAEGVDQAEAALNQIGLQAYAAEVVTQNGVDPLTVGLLQRYGLMNDTALGGMSRESLDGAYPGSTESVLSAEGLAGMAADGGKALLHGAGDMGANILRRFGVIKKVTTEAVESAEKAAVGALDHAAERAGTEAADKAAGDAVKETVATSTKDTIKSGKEAAEEGVKKLAGKLSAKNAAAAAAAAVMVAGGIAMLLKSVPAANATAEAKNSYFGKVVQWVRGIKLPWAKLDVTTGEGGEAAGKLTVNGKVVKSASSAAEEAAGKAATSGPLGWTKEAVEGVKSKILGLGKSVGGAFDGLAGKFSALTGAGEAAGKAASEQVAAKGGSATVAKAAGVFAHGSYVAGVFTILALISAVVYFVVVGGLRLIRKSAQG